MQTIIYRLIRFAVQWMSCLPHPVALRMGEALGLLWYLVPMERKTVALENIRHSFKTMTLRECRRLLRKTYLHFGRMFVETPFILKLSPNNLDRYITFENPENLDRALEKGKGAFVLSAHYGNWELMAAAVTIRWGRTAMIARPADFGPLDRVMTELRSRHGAQIIPKQRAMKPILKALKQRFIIGILLDQNVDWYEGVFIPFLGRWACTNRGLALITARTETPVIPAFAVRGEDGRYQIVFEEELPLHKTGDTKADVDENTALFTRTIERYIIQHPDHWFWFHKRWKTRNYCEWKGGVEGEAS